MRSSRNMSLSGLKEFLLIYIVFLTIRRVLQSQPRQQNSFWGLKYLPLIICIFPVQFVTCMICFDDECRDRINDVKANLVPRPVPLRTPVVQPYKNPVKVDNPIYVPEPVDKEFINRIPVPQLISNPYPVPTLKQVPVDTPKEVPRRKVTRVPLNKPEEKPDFSFLNPRDSTDMKIKPDDPEYNPLNPKNDDNDPEGLKNKLKMLDKMTGSNPRKTNGDPKKVDKKLNKLNKELGLPNLGKTNGDPKDIDNKLGRIKDKLGLPSKNTNGNPDKIDKEIDDVDKALGKPPKDEDDDDVDSLKKKLKDRVKKFNRGKPPKKETPSKKKDFILPKSIKDKIPPYHNDNSEEEPESKHEEEKSKEASSNEDLDIPKSLAGKKLSPKDLKHGSEPAAEKSALNPPKNPNNPLNKDVTPNSVPSARLVNKDGKKGLTFLKPKDAPSFEKPEVMITPTPSSISLELNKKPKGPLRITISKQPKQETPADKKLAYDSYQFSKKNPLSKYKKPPYYNMQGKFDPKQYAKNNKVFCNDPNKYARKMSLSVSIERDQSRKPKKIGLLKRIKHILS